MGKLSKREKFLLYLLAVVVIVAGMVWLVINPLTKKSDQLDADISSALLTQSEMQALIGSRAAIEADIASYNTRITEMQDSFLPVMTSDDLDRYITGLLQSNGLTAASLSITTGEEQDAPGIAQYYVKVTAGGQLSQFVALADQTAATAGIRISDLAVRAAGERELLADGSLVEVTATKEQAKNAKVEDAPKKTVVYYDVTIGFSVVEYDASTVEALLPEA